MQCIKQSLKNVFKSGKVWGYSFKEDKNKHVFKIVDLRYGIHDNEPGKVIGDVKVFLCLHYYKNL